MDKKFQIVEEPGGFYTVKDVPIFETHDNRGFNCDEAWLQEAVRNHTKLKEAGYRPTVIIGHNQKGVEKESYGFLDNLKVVGKRLYADMVRIPKEIKEKILKNAYPNRSLEILPTSKRVLCCALLGGTTPHFALPQMTYQNEDSVWCKSLANNNNDNVRSLEMPFSDEQKKELYGIIGEAVKAAMPNAMQETAQHFSRREEPQVYAISTQEALKALESGGMPQLVQGEDGCYYSIAEDGTTYQWPQWIENYGVGSVAGKVAHIAGEIPSRAKVLAGKTLPNLGKRALNGYMGAGEKLADLAVKHPKRAIAAGVGAIGAIGAGEYLAGRHTGKQGKKAGFGGAYLGGPLYVAGNKSGQIAAGYAFDDRTGIMYYDGEAVGMINPLAEDEPEAIPEINEGMSPDLETDPGSENGNLEAQELKGGAPFIDSDGVDTSAAGYALATHDAQLYDLQHQVSTLQNANAILQASKTAESYKAYLLDLKRRGVQVGDVQQQVDYMMTLNNQQIKMHQQHLEQLPKVDLGVTSYSATQADGADREIELDYAQHTDEYKRLGVSLSDLKAAKYIHIGGK